MTNVKFIQTASLPDTSQKGSIYFLSDGINSSIHLGKSDGTYLAFNNINDIKQSLIDLQDELISKVDKAELATALEEYYANTSDNIMGLFNMLDEHQNNSINSENGLHNIRIWQGKFEQYDAINSKWDEIKLSEIDITTLQLTANQITESTNKQFIDAVLKSQITSNANDISNFGQRIADLENLLDESSGTDEKVKLNENDNSGFLEDKIDGTSIRNINGKLGVASLDGLTATITELNLLQGVSSNIQAQIDSLNAVGNFTTSVDTKLELEALTDMKANDMVIVLEDETINESPTSIYIYNGTTWTFAGFFKGGELRDFTINPIDLIAESKGTLPKTRYELQTALDTSFVDSTGSIKSMNVQDGLKEVFQFSDNVRKQWSNVIGAPLTSTDKLLEQIVKYEILMENIALALTEKGVPTYSHNKLNEIPSKISAIASTAIEAGLNKTPKLTVTTPFTYDIILNESLSHNNIATSLIKFEDGSQNVMHYDMNFENSDEDKFINNPNVTFGGKLKLANNSNFNMTKDDSWQGEDNLYRYTVVRDEWTSIDKIEVM